MGLISKIFKIKVHNSTPKLSEIDQGKIAFNKLSRQEQEMAQFKSNLRIKAQKTYLHFSENQRPDTPMEKYLKHKSIFAEVVKNACENFKNRKLNLPPSFRFKPSK